MQTNPRGSRMIRTVALEPTLNNVAILDLLVTGHIPRIPVSTLIRWKALDQDCYLIEYPRASIHAENARLNVSTPC
jgi:hypothetical protein